MACRFEYNGKSYDQDGLAKELEKMLPDEASKYIPGVESLPNAPFKKSWHELALKRMIREAAAGGYERLSWTPGEAQAARYDLSKQVDSVHYNPETHRLVAKKNNADVINESSVPPEKLADYVGKDVAKKIMEQEPNVNGLRSLNGDGLKIGGEGMKGFYDQIIPKAVEKIGKEHGVKVKPSFIAPTREYFIKEHKFGGENKGKTSYDLRWKEKDGDERLNTSYPTKEEAEKRLAELQANKGEPIHYIDIPQSLKDTALRKGFPLFSSGLMLSPVEHNPFEENK